MPIDLGLNRPNIRVLPPQRDVNVAPRQGDMHTVSIIRHGTTNFNDAHNSVDRIRGWKDIPLNEQGRQEAQKLAQKIARNPPDVLVTSDLARARETAQIISSAIGLPITEESQGYRPWNVGKYAGQLSKDAVPVLADYAVNKPDQPIDGGESFNTFKDRFFEQLAKVLDAHPGQHVAIVTHHRNERLMMAWKKEGFPADGEIDKVEFSKQGERPGHVEKMQVPRSRLEIDGHDNGPTKSKAEAGYTDHSPYHDHCGTCSMFVAPHGCTLVAGTIVAQGWCRYFEAAK